MRQYLGSIVFVVLSVLVSVVGVATKWPWPKWAWIAITAAFLLGAALSFPVKSRTEASSAFVDGDASGSIFGNVYSDAQTFIHGPAQQALFWNIIHRPRSKQR
jgi:purine-cytosine permease-like protein